MAGKDDVVVCGRGGVDQAHHQPGRLSRHAGEVVGDRGELHQRPARGGQVVEADDREELRYLDPPLRRGVQRPERHDVVRADQHGWRVVVIQQLQTRPEPGVEVERPVADVLAPEIDVVLLEQAAQDRLAALTGARRAWTEHRPDVSVTETDDLVDELRHAWFGIHGDGARVDRRGVRLK
jgi:hypothetical protein